MLNSCEVLLSLMIQNKEYIVNNIEYIVYNIVYS